MARWWIQNAKAKLAQADPSFIGIEAGRCRRYRYDTKGLDTIVRLRESVGGRERTFWLDELTELDRIQVDGYNRALRSEGYRELPSDPQPLRDIDSMVPDFPWCHKCGKIRPGKRGTCEDGCIEARAFNAVECT